jgi:hypothetical protein
MGNAHDHEMIETPENGETHGQWEDRDFGGTDKGTGDPGDDRSHLQDLPPAKVDGD